MNSIHDNQATIEKEKKEQLAREEKKEEIEDATKAITQNQTEQPILTEEQIASAKPLFTPEEIAKIEEENIYLNKQKFDNEEAQAEKDAQLKKLEEENFELKKFISENSLHTKAQELKQEVQSSEQPLQQ